MCLVSSPILNSTFASWLTTISRLILYYPVSALVTLFANILQNPQDARARGDLRLMSSVVSFLTMLERDVSEANGNVRRMLSVCSEFERIAKVVLDKAERDMRNGRGKRKAAGGGVSGGGGMTEREREKAMRDRGKDEIAIAEALDEGKTLEMMQVETQAAYRRPVQTPSLRASMEGSSHGASPASWGGSQAGTGTDYRTPPQHQQHQQQQQQHRQQAGQQPGIPPEAYQAQQPMQTSNGHWTANPAANTPYNIPNGATPPFTTTQSPAQPPLPQADPNFPQPALMDGSFAPGTGFSPGMPGPDALLNDFGTFNGGQMGGDAGGMGSFQQPFVPQDLWQMPMTLEWDWAEGLGLGSFTPGPMTGMFDGGGAGGGGFMGQDGQGGQ